MILDVKDKSGRKIYLTDERLKHILKHPEMQDKLAFQRIGDTLTNPDKVIQDSYDLNKHLYFRYYKNKKAYLLVIVKYLNGNGYIISSFETDSIK